MDTSTAALRQAKALSINKIGHAMHDLDPVFDRFSHGPELAGVAAAVGLQQPRIWQSMASSKQPGIGGEVGWHQDATFFHARSAERGHLLVRARGCRRRQRLLGWSLAATAVPRQRFVREGRSVRMETIDPHALWPSGPRRAVAGEGGHVGRLHGLLPHYSARQSLAALAPCLHLACDRRPRATAWATGCSADTALPVRGV